MKKGSIIFLLLPLLMTGCGSNPNPTSSSSSSSTSSSTSEPVQDKKFVFNETNTPSLVDEASTFSTKVKLFNEEEFVIQYSDAKRSNDNHISLSDGGYIQNKEMFPGINKVTVNFTGGSLKYCFGYSTSEANEVELTSNVTYDKTSKYSYFKLVATGEVTIKDITFEIKDDADLSYQYVQSFENDHFTVLETKEFRIGTEVNVSTFKNPSPIYYEDKQLDFLGFAVEEYENVKASFILGDKPVSLYPVFKDVQRFSWTHDPINHTYTSTKAGVRPIIYAEGQRYGRYSADFEIANTSTTGIGLMWNAILPETSYPYGDNCNYYYFHLNPNNGGCQFSKVTNGAYTALKTYVVATNSYWNGKWSKWNSEGRVEPLTITMTAEFTPVSTTIYIDGACIGCYTTTSELSLFDSTVIGIRTNTAGNVARNFKFEKYVGYANGFNNFEDNSYVSYLNNVSTVVPNYNAKCLKFSADMTITSTVSNARSGLMIRAYRPTEESSATNWTHQSGYYMHHNVTANANFTATSIYDNTYAKHPDGSTGNIGSIAYNQLTTGVLGEYYQNNSNYYAGLTSALTIRLSFELTKEHIAIYLNDALIYKKADNAAVSYFDSLDSNTGVGFVAGTYGVKFSNMEVEIND